MASSGSRSKKRPGKAAPGARTGRSSARKSVSQNKRAGSKIPAAPRPDVQQEAGATVYPERPDVPHPGMTDSNERINAEDHSSPRSRLHDGSESVVRHSEESASADRAGRTADRSGEAQGPGEAARTSDERSGAAGPASAYYEEAGERLDERRGG